MSGFHGQQTPTQGIHVVHAYEFVDNAARDAATYTSTDVGKVVRVGATEPYTFYVVSGVSPLVFVAFGGGVSLPLAVADGGTGGTTQATARAGIGAAAAADKGIANGYAPLDANALVPFANLPIIEEGPQILDGMSIEKLDITIVDVGGLQVEVEAVGGGDVRCYVNGEVNTLDCTTGPGTGGKARAALTAGADAQNPQVNFVYITGAAGVATLNVSTSLPTGSFAWVCVLLVPDATTWATSGAYKLQHYTESFLNDSRGALSHQREKLRALGAVYIEGGETTLSISTATSPDTVHAQVAAAQVYQLHRQSFPAFVSGPYYLGNSASIFSSIAHLGLVTALSDGTALQNNDRINLVIWGAVNIDSGESKLFVNLPNTAYAADANAIADTDNSADYSVPADMRSVAFMVARVALRYQAAGGGTWTPLGVFSLLGDPVGVRSGGATAVGSSEFSDGAFQVFNAADSSKRLAFDVSGVAAATLRTLVVPDANGTLYLNPGVVPQAEAEAGTATTERIWTAQRVAQAIAALGGGGNFTYIDHDQDGTGYSSNATSEVDAHVWTTPVLDAGTYMILFGCTQKNNTTTAQTRVRFYFDATKIGPESATWYAQNVNASGNRFSIADHAYITVASGGSTHTIKNTMETSGSATTLSIETSIFTLFKVG